MRESNHSFPANGRAAICVQSGVYDRRGESSGPSAFVPAVFAAGFDGAKCMALWRAKPVHEFRANTSLEAVAQTDDEST